MADDTTRAAVAACLDVLLRMIPEYCREHAAEPSLDTEHDAAVAQAAAVLYGPDRRAWPPGVRCAAEGQYS